jgi:hypothetical protein
MEMRDSRCDGAPLESPFSGTAAVGSINRFMPKEMRYFLRRDDRFLGYEDLDFAGGTRRCSVWGWYEHDPASGLEIGWHKVYVAVRNGWPMKEVQTMAVEGGAAIEASVDFSFDFASTDVSEGWYLGIPQVEASIFAIPDECNINRQKVEAAKAKTVPHPWGNAGQSQEL